MPTREVMDDPELATLLPKTGEHPVRTEAILLGVNSAIANGLRRALLSEMSTLALVIDKNTWSTTDEFAIVDMIITRVLLITLTQAQVKPGMKFTLRANNETDAPQDILTRQFARDSDSGDTSKKERGHDALPFFDTIVVLTLRPHRKISFTAVVTQGIGRDHAAFNTAFTSISIPLDQRPLSHPSTGFPNVEPELPYNERAQYLASCMVSDPHDYMLIFETAGKGTDGAIILARALDNLIGRVEAVRTSSVSQGQEKQREGSSASLATSDLDTVGVFTITIPNETDTVGQIFAKSAIVVHPDIDYVASCASNHIGTPLRIYVRPGDMPIVDLIARATDHALSKLRALRANLAVP
jgi:hypothetical protein